MLKFIQLVQKRPSDKAIRIIGALFGLTIILAGYYNLIYQGDELNSTIFGAEVMGTTILYFKYAIIAL